MIMDEISHQSLPTPWNRKDIIKFAIQSIVSGTVVTNPQNFFPVSGHLYVDGELTHSETIIRGFVNPRPECNAYIHNKQP